MSGTFGRPSPSQTKFSKSARSFFLNCTWIVENNSTHGCLDEMNSWLGVERERSVFLVLPCFIITFVSRTAAFAHKYCQNFAL